MNATLASARRQVARAVELFERTLPGRVWKRLVEMEFVDRSVALAAKAFVSFFPLVVVVAAFVPDSVRVSMITTVGHRFGLIGQDLVIVRQAFASPEVTRQATGWLGLLLLFFYATSFTTALQRVYLRAWRRPVRAGMRGNWRGLAWLAGAVLLTGLFGSLRRALGGVPGDLAFATISVVGTTGLWWSTMWLMLRGHVRWRVLLPPAVLTAVAMLTYAQLAVVWMPASVAKNEAQFGFFGVALALVTWFVGVSFVIVVGAAIGPVLAEDDGVVGRLVRGGSGPLTVQAQAVAGR